MRRALRTARTRARYAADLPPVSLLVPLHGEEYALEENLRSFALQDYPVCQLVLGVARADDRALAIARRVAAALPDRNIEINVGEVPGARNPKIANVLSMMRLVRHKVLILADSDTRVKPGVRPLRHGTLARSRRRRRDLSFRRRSDDTFSAKLGAMFMNEQFIPSVLVNRLFGPLRHCLGPTNAVRSAVLSAIGGFEALAPHLADDFMLGNFVAARGLRVVISRYVVRTIVSDSTLAALWNHELRWHRTIRGVQPAGYAGMFLTYPLPLALLAFLLAPRPQRVVTLFVAASRAYRVAARFQARVRCRIRPGMAGAASAISSGSPYGRVGSPGRRSAGATRNCTSNRAMCSRNGIENVAAALEDYIAGAADPSDQ